MKIYENLSIESLPNEEWRDVFGWEGLYQVSNLGRVKSLATYHKTLSGYTSKERIIKPHIGKRGYYVVVLYANNVSKHRPIHRLVAEAFIPNNEHKRAIDHIDTNKLNNSIDNLRWCSDKENCNNPITIEKMRQNGLRLWKEGAFDNRNNTHYRKVAQYTKDGEYIKTWDSIKEVEDALGIDASSISAVCLGTNPHRKTSGGFIWKHVGGHYIKERNE